VVVHGGEGGRDWGCWNCLLLLLRVGEGEIAGEKGDKLVLWIWFWRGERGCGSAGGRCALFSVSWGRKR
jgi:hypothetical protein